MGEPEFLIGNIIAKSEHMQLTGLGLQKYTWIESTWKNEAL